ncbi:MAG: TAXI family TRAP transporter solute-binding subunit [Planctomycetota bacterium]
MIAERIRHCFTGRKWSLILSAGLAILSILLLMDFENPRLRLSAGPNSTRRHAIAAWLCEQASKNDLSIDLLSNAGSEECLNLLKSKQLDVAIVSNGVVVPDDENIAVLASLHLEAVHLLVRKDLATLVRKDLAEKNSLIEAIRGKRIHLGEKGSTEWLLSRDFLHFMKLSLPSTSHPGDIIPTALTKSELLKTLQAILQADGADREALLSELPDCLFVLSSMPSSIVQTLVEAANFEIVPIPSPRAFLLDNLQDTAARTTLIHREFLEPTSIAKHSYFFRSGYPSTDCETIGVRLLVVARKDVSPIAVKKLMAAIFEGEFNHRITPKSPRDIATPYTVHPASAAYLDRNKPLIVNSILEWVSNGLSIFGAFSAGALSLYSLLRKKRSRNPSDYFTEIRLVERLAYEASSDSEEWIQRKAFLKQLEDRLIKLRHDLLEDVCEGRIKGDQVIANIMMLLVETRRSLSIVEGRPAESADHVYKVFRNAA